jgi:molybdopterin synthase catalytic subunit
MIAATVQDLRIEREHVLQRNQDGVPIVTAECYVFKPKRAGAFDPDAFRGMINELKKRVPEYDRSFNDETKFWGVRVEHREVLAELFENFEGAEEAVKSQLVMF